MSTAPYPRLEPVHVEMDIDSRKWAIWSGVGRPPDLKDRLGALLQGQPHRRSCVDIACDGWRVRLVPTYEFSTWDRFVVDGEPKVRASALKGVFPFTLGEQETLLDGVLDVLRGAASVLSRIDPGAATTLGEIAARIQARRLRARVAPAPTAPDARPSHSPK